MFRFVIILLLVSATVSLDVEGLPKRKLKVFVDSPSLGYSHMQFQGRLADLLTEAGHTVDVYISNFNPAEKRSGTTKVNKVVRINATTPTKFHELDLFTDPFNSGNIIFQMNRAEPYRNTTAQFCYDIVNHPTLINDIKKEQYDVIIAEMFDPCIFYLAEYVGIPTRILSSAMPTPDLVAHAMGVPVPRSYIPSVLASSADVPELGWTERFFNLLTDFYHPIVLEELTERMSNMYKTRFGVKLPGFRDLLRRSTYIFANVHDQLDHPRPVTRKMHYIGGIAVKQPSKNHPKEIEAIFQRPSKGLILFSMGSLIDSTLMPKQVKEAFMKTFATFSEYTFLWRIKVNLNDSHEFRNVTNLFTTDWMDQPTILADQRTKAFITHCGQNSAMEAAYNGVPVLGLPLFADQHYNNALLINRGMGLYQDVREVTSEQLIEKLQILLSDESYSINANRLKHKLKDEPFKPKDRFVALIEYAARHQNLGELDLYVTKLDFIRRNNLDIYLPLLSLTLLMLYMSLKSASYIVNQLAGLTKVQKVKNA